jgi:hypothetical protein
VAQDIGSSWPREQIIPEQQEGTPQDRDSVVTTAPPLTQALSSSSGLLSSGLGSESWLHHTQACSFPSSPVLALSFHPSL